jgi:hypothetical protein
MSSLRRRARRSVAREGSRAKTTYHSLRCSVRRTVVASAASLAPTEQSADTGREYRDLPDEHRFACGRANARDGVREENGERNRVTVASSLRPEVPRERGQKALAENSVRRDRNQDEDRREPHVGATQLGKTVPDEQRQTDAPCHHRERVNELDGFSENSVYADRRCHEQSRCNRRSNTLVVGLAASLECAPNAFESERRARIARTLQSSDAMAKVASSK